MKMLMDVKEQQQIIQALGRWFQSQDIQDLDSLVILMKVYAIFMGACAPSIEELGKGLLAAQLDIEEIAVQSFLRKKDFQ